MATEIEMDLLTSTVQAQASDDSLSEPPQETFDNSTKIFVIILIAVLVIIDLGSFFTILSLKDIELRAHANSFVDKNVSITSPQLVHPKIYSSEISSRRFDEDRVVLKFGRRLGLE
ncbi:uncharacterized protein LOC135128283 isoform X2 [Zophobas morio]|uniref:uncharacterized protein LOC135128283 isoform X2 n=1 Tax=Zophobas morio TaxID=2755281 RepID=UPI003083437E